MATSSAPTGDGIVPEDHPPQDGALASESDSAESAAGREQEEEEEEAGQEEEEEDEEEASDEDDAAFDSSLAHSGSVSLPALHCLGATRCAAMILRCVALRSNRARSGRCRCLALCKPSACRSCCYPPTCSRLSLTAFLALQAQSSQQHLHGLFEQNALLLDRFVC